MSPRKPAFKIPEAVTSIAHSVLVLAIIVLFLVSCFLGYAKLLVWAGAPESWWLAGGTWLLIGAICAAYWPFKYRKNLDEPWTRYIKHWALLSFAGPFALLLGIPL